MSNGSSVQVSREAQAIISDFGRNIGIPDLRLDTEGFCQLELDGHPLNISYDHELDDFVFFSDIGAPPVSPGEHYFARLHDLNYGAILTGAGALAVDRNAGVLRWLNRVRVEGLTQERFQKEIILSVSRIKMLREAAARGLE